MAIELECKVRVAGHDGVRERLRHAGGTPRSAVLETNRLFDDAGLSLRRRGCGLRVREWRSMAGGGAGATLTFKGPQQAGPYKQREEVEVSIGDAAAMERIMAALGLSPTVVFEKRRETWDLDGCRVELDELPGLGCFVEVEADGESAIRRCLERLGLQDLAPIRESYAALLAESAGSPAERPIVARFAPPAG